MAVASTSGMKKCKEAKTARICGARNGEQEAKKKKGSSGTCTKDSLKFLAES